MVDNTAKLSKVLKFKPNTYYKFVVLLREKDGKTVLQSYNKKELIVKQWLIDSQEKLDEMLPDMKTFADKFNGRLYMTVDRKDVAKTLFYMQDKITAYTRQMFFGNRTEVSVKQLNKLLASASSASESSSGDKMWLYDVDTKDLRVLKYIEKECGEYYVATFETKNGFHVLARREFRGDSILGKSYADYAYENGLQMAFLTPNNTPVVECKENALTLVYAHLNED